MDEVEALTELKSRISADDWRTICDYVFKERELADQALASSRNDVLEEAANNPCKNCGFVPEKSG